MTAHELVKLKDSRVFRDGVMDAIIEEFVPAADSFRLTDMFLPFKNVDKDILMDLINNGAFGRTSPINLGADHARISLPGHTYKEHRAGHWREAIKFDEETLLRAVNPQLPTERWGDGLAASALNVLDLRLNNMIELVTSKILINGVYSEARFGVNYTYDAKIPAKYMQDVTATPGWTTGGTWSNRANSTPIADIIGSVNLFRRYGFTATTTVMSINTLEDYYLSADTQAMIKASPQLVGLSANRQAIFETLTNMKIELDDRRYAEETILTAASPVNDTIINVVNASEFTAGEVCTMRNSLGEEEEVTVSSIAANAVTLTAGVTKTYVVGDRLTVYKQFLPDNYYLIRGENDDRVSPNNWLSTPSLIKGRSWTDPQPGRYTWNDFNEKVPYTLEIGAGIDGGPKVSRPTWMRVKTQ